MSYSSTDSGNTFNSEGTFASGAVGGAIIMGSNGLMTSDPVLGNTPEANYGDTTGPNAVNPSGTQSGIRHAQQTNFRSYTR